MHRKRTLQRLATSLGGLALLGICGTSAPAQVLTKTITYTRFSGPPDNVKRVQFTYNAGTATVAFGPRITITSTPGADGVLFSPDGSLIVGGQANAVYRVDPGSGLFTAVTAGGTSAFHVMLDPSGTKVWTGGIPGGISDVPVIPLFLNGTAHAVVGDDTLITHMTFIGNQVFYTTSLPSGLGNWGTIDLNTFTTTRLAQNVPWAHGMCFDCLTEDLMVYANNMLVQIDPVSHNILSTLDLSGLGFFIQLDQGTSDGQGHLYIASNTGHMLFVDLAASGLVGSPLNFVAAPFLDDSIDDIAPDCGLGAPPSCPRTQGYWKNHASAWPVTSLTIGCQTYTRAQCLTLLNTPTGGGNQADASLILAKQLIAAKLNVANNSKNWPLIVPVIDQADALLCTFVGVLPYNVSANTPAGQQMVILGQQLDAYNNGALAPGCHG